MMAGEGWGEPEGRKEEGGEGMLDEREGEKPSC